jgi:hypothetical protein
MDRDQAASSGKPTCNALRWATASRPFSASSTTSISSSVESIEAPAGSDTGLVVVNVRHAREGASRA